jgi:hypothetical protein
MTSPGLEEGLRRAKRLQGGVRLDLDRAVRAHGEARAQLLLDRVVADRHHHDLLGLPRLADAQRFLERDLIERIDAHLDAVDVDAAAVGQDAHADVVVHHALDTNEYFH